MRPAGHPLPPTSSLPPLRLLDDGTEEQIFLALDNLYALYCPLPLSIAFQSCLERKKPGGGTSTPLVDSGYASGDEGEDEDFKDARDPLISLRADVFERNVAERWLTGFLARAEELSCFSSDDARERAVEKASCVLSSFFASTADEKEKDEEDQITRDFSFEVAPLAPDTTQKTVFSLRLNDRLAGTNSADHTDVGLQSWGASIVFSQLICASPARFGLTPTALGPSPRIVELGAGTGLVSHVLGTALPHLGVACPTVIATDYHLSVLANLRANIATNFPSRGPPPVDVCLLDWSAPSLAPPLDAPADMLVATDVVYAPEHALWLRDCAARLLAPEGTFWLMATVRPNGKFEALSDTVKAAFTASDRPRAEDGRTLTIKDEEILEKRKGIGRGDESGYRLFRIGWV